MAHKCRCTKALLCCADPRARSPKHKGPMSTGLPSPARSPCHQRSGQAGPAASCAGQLSARDRGRWCSLAGPLRRPCPSGRAAAGRPAGIPPGGDHQLAARSAYAEPDRARPRGPRAHRLGRSRGSATRCFTTLLHLFDANAFYPHPLSLAFSDSLLGYGPGRVLRLGHRRRARPLQPAVPVRVVAVLRRRLPAGAGARPRPLRRRRRRPSPSPTPPTGSPRPGTCT